MRRLLTAFLILALPALALASDRNGAQPMPLGAGDPVLVLPANGQWHYSAVGLGQVGPDGLGGWMYIPAQVDLWHVSSSSGIVVQVTDAFLSGDRFEVYVDGTLAASSSVPSGSGNISPAYPDCACPYGAPAQVPLNRAFYSPKYGHCALRVPAGNHTINLKGTVLPFGGAGLAIRAFPNPQAAHE
jgi:hypothetical protein